MTTVQGLIDSVKSEAQFDVTDTQALTWLDRRHKKMVLKARALRKTTSLTTVANQRDYSLPTDLVEIDEVTVDGLVYGTGTHSDLSMGAQGWISLSGPGGIVASEEDSSGAGEIALYPTPTQAGLAILVRGIWRPASLQVGVDSTLLVPDDHQDALISGAIATGLKRQEYRPDLAQVFEQEFNEGVEEWRREVRRRYRGSGPARIRIQGVNI